MHTGDDGPEFVELGPGASPADDVLPAKFAEVRLRFGVILDARVYERLLDMMKNDSACSWKLSKLRANFCLDLCIVADPTHAKPRQLVLLLL